MNSVVNSILDYIAYFFPLILLIAIVWYLAIFGEVDRSDEHGAIAHKISRKR